MTKKYLDLYGLKKYDSLIKDLVTEKVSAVDPAKVVNSTTSYTTLDAIAADVLANPGKVLRVAYTLVSTSIILPPSGLNYGNAYYLFRALANPTEITSDGEPTVGVIEVTFENISTATSGMRPFGYLRKGYAGSLTKWWWSSWSTNAFQQTLISGSNIKTVGGTSLLSSGNISFKTINSNSIIGSGNIAIESGASIFYSYNGTLTSQSQSSADISSLDITPTVDFVVLPEGHKYLVLYYANVANSYMSTSNSIGVIETIGESGVPYGTVMAYKLAYVEDDSTSTGIWKRNPAMYMSTVHYVDATTQAMRVAPYIGTTYMSSSTNKIQFIVLQF